MLLAYTQWSNYVWSVLPASPVVPTQRSVNVRRGLPLACIEWSFGVKHRTKTSSLTYSNRCVDVESGLPTSFIADTHWSVEIECGLPTLYIANKYRSKNDGRRHTTSTKASTHLTWHVPIRKETSANVMCLQKGPHSITWNVHVWKAT